MTAGVHLLPRLPSAGSGTGAGLQTAVGATGLVILHCCVRAMIGRVVLWCGIVAQTPAWLHGLRTAEAQTPAWLHGLRTAEAQTKAVHQLWPLGKSFQQRAGQRPADNTQAVHVHRE